jgi:hypothetical protein
MLAAVDLDGEFRMVTSEIDDVAIDRRLSPEVEASLA